MAKTIRKFEVDYPIRWGYCTTIETIEQDLAELKKLGATQISFNAYEEHGSPYIEITPHSVRLETDEEYAARIEEMNLAKESKDKAEYERYLVLNEKYENN